MQAVQSHDISQVNKPGSTYTTKQHTPDFQALIFDTMCRTYLNESYVTFTEFKQAKPHHMQITHAINTLKLR